MRLTAFQLLCSISLCSAQIFWTVPDPLGEAGTQFIRYNVTITGTYTHPGTNLTQCGNNGTYDLNIGDNMPLYIGANPPWDPNPFFFWFGRINFKSAAFLCHQNGEPCGSITHWPWYYVHAQLLDLSRATVRVVQNSTGSIYRVTGDQGTFVSNGTELDPALFFTAPGFPVNQTRGTGMRDPAGCVLTESVNWWVSHQTSRKGPAVPRWMLTLSFNRNATVPFTYSLEFSNTSASATVEVASPEGRIALRFAGIRVTGAGLQPYHDHSYAISLAPPEDNPMPRFTFTTGSDFDFAKEGDGTWYAKPKISGAGRRSVGPPHAAVAVLLGVVVLLSF